jgi:Tol biopolymer transport system component
MMPLILLLMACTPVIEISTPEAGSDLIFGLSDGRTVGKLIWSPTNEELAFTAFNPRDGSAQIYILNLGTREVRSLVDLEDGSAQSWSPDGRNIAYNSRREIWIVPADEKMAPEMLGFGQVASYSANGKELAIFDNAGKATPGIYTLRILNLQSGIEKTVLSTNAGDHTIFDLSWSPDDTRLAFSVMPKDVDNKSARRDIYIYSLETEELSQFTDSDHNFYPTWSPTGNQIAYLRRLTNDPYASIIISQVAFKCSILVPDINHVSALAWSPDGSNLAYSQDMGIYLVDLKLMFGDDFLTVGPKCP